jgi:2,3,4,5-tetrahydropyridine-2,6-dicarboxylate N-succinyltransferase
MLDRLQEEIIRLAETPAAQLDHTATELFEDLVEGLNNGSIRAAEPLANGSWRTNAWVKQGILLGFKLGRLTDMSSGRFSFVDKHTYPVRTFTVEDGVRIVPGGSSIRMATYVAPGVVCMPPMYINVGAFVDEGTMIDSHALVGSCAQIGKRVHLSAAAQIGGVLEPVGAQPVIIEDDVFVGGNCGVYEGCLVRRGAVLAPGVVLTSATRLFDAVNGNEVERNADGKVEVPANAVVVPGSRPLNSDYGREQGLALYTPIIVKYRDERTAASTSLEDALR